MPATITIDAEVDDKFLRYVGITAVEGGIGYWSQIEGYGKFVNALFASEENKGEPSNDLGKLSIIDDYTGEIDPDEPTFELTTKLIADGIRTALKPNFKVNQTIRGYIYRAVVNNDSGDIDSTAADVIVQAACFGEIVYG
jgi:hypothetical protein